MIDFLQAKVEFQMELVGASDKNIVLTNGLIQHVESTLNNRTASDKELPVCYHMFNTQQVDVVDKTIKSVMLDGNPYVRWRIGFVTDQQDLWMPWQNHQIVHCSATVRGIGDSSGHMFEMSTANRLYTANRQTKIVARKGKISDMVQAIASEMGVEAVVEPTMGTYSYIQVNESDVEFINRRLIHRAVNDKGRGQYMLYIRDNVLHFHTPDYQSTIKEFIYYDTPFKGMVQTDRSQQLWDMGVSGTRLIAYDPYTGQTTEVLNDPEKYLRLADGIYRLDKVANGTQTLVYHLSTNTPDEATSIAQNVYTFGRAETFRVEIDVARSINYQIGDILQFVLTPRPEKASPWSGYYIITGVTRTVRKESLQTVYTVQRGEIIREQTTITQPNDSAQLIPETTAPGQDLNVSATQNSVLTVGAGKQQSSTIYSTVEDATKAPGT